MPHPTTTLTEAARKAHSIMIDDEQFWMLLPFSPVKDYGMSEEEHSVIQEVFESRLSNTLSGIPTGATVVPRFRALPFGRELEAEAHAQGLTLLNSYRQHRFLADVFAYAPVLEGLTAPVFDVEDIPNFPEYGEWFVKGETNSKKNQWFDYCYADSRRRLSEVVRNNQLDSIIGSQRIAIRPFERFRKVAEGIDGRTIANEWRVFVLDGEVVSEGFYWENFAYDVDKGVLEDAGNPDRLELVGEVIGRVGDEARFFAVDVAQREDGSWTVVELNDGVMSGLSMNDPRDVWSRFGRR